MEAITQPTQSDRRATGRGVSLRTIGLILVVAITLARNAPILYWADIQFDADQAVVGLMAKHVAERRAFPMFQYGLRYVLMIEAWISAPFVALGDGSVSLARVAPALLNAATAGMIYGIASTALGPIVALVVAAPVALPGATTAEDLTKALGMNIEPLFFAVAMWLLRDRPILLGITAAIAVKNREFALYAVAALLFVDLLRDRSTAAWRMRVVALMAFAVTSSSIEILRQHSSPLGPNSSYAMLAGSGDNLGVATGSMCIDPAFWLHDLRVTTTRLLPAQFGVTNDARTLAAAYGAHPLEAPWLWLPLVGMLAFAGARGLFRAWRHGATTMTWFGLYLVLVGAQAVVVYALTRCGHTSMFTMRYTLLSLLIPAGALILGFERESRPSIRVALIGIVSVWIAVVAAGHVSLTRALLTAQPVGTYRRLADYLEQQHVQYIITDYLIGYHVAYLTGERVQPLTNFERVHDYTLAVEANLDRAVEVRRAGGERCPGVVEVAGFYICPPNQSSPRP